MKKYLSLLILPLIFSCGNKSNFQQILIQTSGSNLIQTTTNQYVFPFNTYMSLKYYKDTNENKITDFDKNISNLFTDTVIELHKKLDRHYYYYKDDGTNIITNVKTINDSYATGEEIICSNELYDLIKLGYQMTLDTNGKFNFFAGALTSYWDNILQICSTEPTAIAELDPIYSSTVREEIKLLQESIPTVEEIQNLITFNDGNKSIIFNALEDKENLDRDRLDSKYRPYITSGGISKGFATDILKNILLENNYTRGYLNSGSSTITSLSDKLFEVSPYQTISITDPRYQSIFGNEVIAKIKLDKDYSLSTSGTNTYEKSYFVTDPSTGKLVKRHHIINPETGEPSLYHAGVTIISNTFTNGELDALSTAIINMSTDETIGFYNSLNELYPNHDLSIILVDTNENDELKYTILGDIKNNITIINGEIN